jgi:Flp pilus assembly protein protease CpaA
LNFTLSHIFLAVAATILFYVSVNDWKHLKVKNGVVLILIVLGIAYAISFPDPVEAIINGVIVFFLTVFLGFIIFVVGGWGAGDAKLFAASSMFLDPSDVLFYFTGSLVFSFFVGTLYYFKNKEEKITIQKFFKQSIPFAPGMFLSFLVCMGL